MSGPPGTLEMVDPGGPTYMTGIHVLSFVPGYPEELLPGPGIIRDGTVLTPGTYTFTSPGGSYEGPLSVPGSGPFSISLTLPELLDWTNRDALGEIDRSQPLTITWANGVPGGWINIAGTSIFGVGGYGPVGLTFSCWTDAAAGSFTVPPEIVSALPASIETDSPATSSLFLAQWIFEDRFTLSGVDVGRAVSADSIYKTVRFH